MVEKHDTPLERPTSRIILEDEIDRLRGWLKLLKKHTLNGSLLALIDAALEGRKPLEEDLIPDRYCYDDMQVLRRKAETDDKQTNRVPGMFELRTPGSPEGGGK